MLFIYCNKITNRVDYIFSLYFREILGLNIRLTDDSDEFKSYNGPKISYTSHPISNELFFLSKSLLFENDIKQMDINIFDWEGVKVFFPTNKNSSLPFDPFSAGFYLVSRYEEYLPHIEDKFDRFEAKESFAFQHDFIKKPMINLWAKCLKKILTDRFPDLSFPETKYQFISSLDIDNAFAYREKGFIRNLGAFSKSLIGFNFDDIKERSKVLLGLIPDPYDTYEYQLSLQKKYKFKSIYFFLLADYGLNDKNISVNNRKLHSLIKSISDYFEVGIHPGFGSNSSKNKLKIENRRLESILKREVTKSRQHFLKLSFPETYRNLIELDISDDYTMGYASSTGFRSSICTSFYFYDLDLELKTALKIHPFTAMEATLKDYMNLSPQEAINELKMLIDEVKNVDGTFISIWHNESLSDSKNWTGWRKVYEEMVKYALPND